PVRGGRQRTLPNLPRLPDSCWSRLIQTLTHCLETSYSSQRSLLKPKTCPAAARLPVGFPSLLAHHLWYLGLDFAWRRRLKVRQAVLPKELEGGIALRSELGAQAS